MELSLALEPKRAEIVFEKKSSLVIFPLRAKFGVETPLGKEGVVCRVTCSDVFCRSACGKWEDVLNAFCRGLVWLPCWLSHSEVTVLAAVDEHECFEAIFGTRICVRSEVVFSTYFATPPCGVRRP